METSGSPGDEKVGKYRVVRTIGKGNFAKVKLAVHVLTGKEVAVKVVDKARLNASGLIKLFREVRILKMLDHPNIVKLLEVIETDAHLFLVMEYCAGGEVFDYLVSHGRMKERDARKKFRQILSAVDYCHQHHVIHRDLKAENLLLDSSLNVKIADFGFSNEYHPGGRLETFCGSPPYAAPELFQGRKYEGPEVDIWSLGVILYTLVSGMLPFDGQNLRELREAVLRGKFRVPFYMSTECEALIRRMLVLNPSKRASMKSIMEDKWTNLECNEKLQSYIPPEIKRMDNERIEIMVHMGFEYEEIVTSLNNDAYDDVMATYILLDREKFGPHDPTMLQHVDRASLSPIIGLHDKTKKTYDANGKSNDGTNEPSESSNLNDSSIGNARDTLESKTPSGNPITRPRSKTTNTNVKTDNQNNDEKSPSFFNRLSIRFSGRKNTLDQDPNISDGKNDSRNSDTKSPGRPKTDETPKPRSLHFTWSMKTTSAKEAEDVLQEVIRVLRLKGVAFEQREHFLLLCFYNGGGSGVQFEVEVCKLPRVKLNGVRFKRIAGTSMAFKNIASAIADALRL